MRKTNPWEKVFTRDLIVDDDETANAFWGYHIGNNFGRLLGIDGTLMFEAATPSLTPTARVGIESLQLTHAPIIQAYSRTDFLHEVTIRTVTKELPNAGGGVAIPILTHHTRLWFGPYISQGPPTGLPLVGDEITVGDNFPSNEEVMLINEADAFPAVPPTQWLIRYRVQRGYRETPIHSYGEDELLYRVTDVTLSDVEVQDYYKSWPPYLEAFAEQEVVTFKWMIGYGGTVYFKIFGA
jgi:hypothetical protein